MFKHCIFMICLVFVVSSCGSRSADMQSSAQTSQPQTAAEASPTAATVSSPPNQQEPASSSSKATFVDACSLIDKAEIASVQGENVKETTPGTQLNGALAISTCYYTVASTDGSKNLSVHLEVIRPDQTGGNPNAVIEYWQKAFHSDRKRDEDGEKETSKPLPVPGVGEEAYWTGNSKAGAVYALTKGKMLRVSVGGPDDVKTKIEKSKTLIANAMKRLS